MVIGAKKNILRHFRLYKKKQNVESEKLSANFRFTRGGSSKKNESSTSNVGSSKNESPTSNERKFSKQEDLRDLTMTRSLALSQGVPSNRTSNLNNDDGLRRSVNFDKEATANMTLSKEAARSPNSSREANVRKSSNASKESNLRTSLNSSKESAKSPNSSKEANLKKSLNASKESTKNLIVTISTLERMSKTRDNVTLSRNATINRNATLTRNATLSRNATLGRNATFSKNKVIEREHTRAEIESENPSEHSDGLSYKNWGAIASTSSQPLSTLEEGSITYEFHENKFKRNVSNFQEAKKQTNQKNK